YIESLSSQRRGGPITEGLKKSFAESFGYNIKLSGELRLELGDFWMYCTSIDPKTNTKRMRQMGSVSPDYDFMAGIADPSKFAISLGLDVIRRIKLDKDFKINPDTMWVTVTHGPVIYWAGNLPQSAHDEVQMEDIGPFIKRKQFEEQQEYRFLIQIPGDTVKQDFFSLKISDELRDQYSRIS
ncbi:MAG: hypothetical protein MJE68_04620, partial [Proteobacteria bacterium]|nr:hypothetical protein [Pseudomonadota bacterium]